MTKVILVILSSTLFASDCSSYFEQAIDDLKETQVLLSKGDYQKVREVARRGMKTIKKATKECELSADQMTSYDSIDFELWTAESLAFLLEKIEE